MPRKAHRQGGAADRRGISSLKVCVVCGTNDLGDSFCTLARRGRPADAGLAGALAGLGPCAQVSTDGHSGYARMLPEIGAAAHDAAPAAESAGRPGPCACPRCGSTKGPHDKGA